MRRQTYNSWKVVGWRPDCPRMTRGPGTLVQEIPILLRWTFRSLGIASV